MTFWVEMGEGGWGKEKRGGRSTETHIWDRKIIHLVVQNDARRGHDKLGAEEEVDGAGDADGHPAGVGCGDVGCAVAVTLLVSIRYHYFRLQRVIGDLG